MNEYAIYFYSDNEGDVYDDATHVFADSTSEAFDNFLDSRHETRDNWDVLSESSDCVEAKHTSLDGVRITIE
jgi:hypothetical protein